MTDRGTEQVSFRIRREVSDQIRKIAEYEKRSVSNLINFVLEAWVEDRDLKFRKKYKIRRGRGTETPDS